MKKFKKVKKPDKFSKIKILKTLIFSPIFDKKLIQMVADFIFIPDIKSIRSNENTTMQFLGKERLTKSIPNEIYKLKIKLNELYKIISIDNINPKQTDLLEDCKTNIKQNFTIPRDEKLYDGTRHLILLTPIDNAVRAKMIALKQLKGSGVKTIETISYAKQFSKHRKWTISPEILTRGGIAGLLAKIQVWEEIERIAESSVNEDALFFNKEHQEQFLKILTYAYNRKKSFELLYYCNKLRWNTYYKN